MNCHPTRRVAGSPHGFSLIEVNLAILVVAGGLLSLFALFPAGLRMSVSAVADTRQSMFSDAALSSLAGSAAKLPLEKWLYEPTDFWAAIKAGTLFDSNSSVLPDIADNTPFVDNLVVEGEIDDYFSAGDAKLGKVPVRYLLRMSRRLATSSGVSGQDKNNRHVDGLTWRFTLICTDQPQGGFDTNPMYHLEVRYPGNP